MENTFERENIDQLLAEADELLQQLDPEILEYMQDEQRAQFEEDTQNLKKLTSEVHDRIAKEGASKDAPYSEGVHEAIDDIVKAMKSLANYISS